MSSSKKKSGRRGSKRSVGFAPRLHARPDSRMFIDSGSGFAVGEGLVPLSDGAFTYTVPYAPFYGAVGSGLFRFSFRHLPYDSLSAFYQDYWDWLSQVSTQMRSLIPELYVHKYDVQVDTIGTMEAFILAALSRVPVNDSDTIAKITTSGVFRMASQYTGFIHPDLHAYIFRLGWTWPALPKLRYLAAATDDDRQIMSALSSMRGAIVNAASPELDQTLTDATVDTLDAYVPAVQELTLMALLARMQFGHQVTVNLRAPSLAEQADKVARWSKRFQMLTPELLAYIQRSRYSSDKVFVPLSTPPAIGTSTIGVAPVWLPTGEVDYTPLVRSGNRSVAFSTKAPRYAVVPRLTFASTEVEVPSNPVSALPPGTVIAPAESVAGMPSASGVWQPTYVSTTGETVEGRPMVAPRVAYVSRNQATLLGGHRSEGNRSGGAALKEPKLCGFDPHAPPAAQTKKTGGCTP